MCILFGRVIQEPGGFGNSSIPKTKRQLLTNESGKETFCYSFRVRLYLVGLRGLMVASSSSSEEMSSLPDFFTLSWLKGDSSFA